MKETLIIIMLLSTVALVGASCGNSEEDYENCKTRCIEDMATGSGFLSDTEPDFSGRNNCIQMCIEKYEE